MRSRQGFVLVSCLLAALLATSRGPAFAAVIAEYDLQENPITNGTVAVDSSGYVPQQNLTYYSPNTVPSMYSTSGGYYGGSDLAAHFNYGSPTYYQDMVYGAGTSSKMLYYQPTGTIEIAFKIDANAPVMPPQDPNGSGGQYILYEETTGTAPEPSLVAEIGGDGHLGMWWWWSGGTNWGGIELSTALQANQWYFFACTYDQTNQSNDVAYLWDGTTMNAQTGATVPTSGSASATPNGVIIGNICMNQVNPAEDTNGFPGDLSHIKIFNTELSAAQVLADAQGGPLPGDANGDGRVDINDLTIVLSHFGATGCTYSQGSMNGDPTGTVDVNDLTIVLSNFGKVGMSDGAGIQAVPEPCAVPLLAAALATLLGCAWRRRA